MPGIVVGIDGSAHAQRALDWAVREAALRDAPLTVITVWRAAVTYWGNPAIYPEDRAHAEQARTDAQEAVDKSLASAGDQRPANVTVRAISGVPAAELVAASTNADMLVVGSRGSGGFSRLLLGSVSTQVVHHSQCPVVVVPDEERHG